MMKKIYFIIISEYFGNFLTLKNEIRFGQLWRIQSNIVMI